MAENVMDINHSLESGKGVIICAMRKKASELYGIPADDWCEEMYKYIDSMYRKLFPDGKK